MLYQNNNNNNNNDDDDDDGDDNNNNNNNHNNNIININIGTFMFTRFFVQKNLVTFFGLSY